jgi:hypothetical protein
MNTLEILIVGVNDVPANAGPEWLSPTGMEWRCTMRNKMPWYVVGEDGYTYSWEEPGIQLLFDEGVTANRAVEIAEAIVAGMQLRGYGGELVVIDGGDGMPVRF